MTRRIQGRALVVVAAMMVLGAASSAFAQAVCTTLSARAKTGSIELAWPAVPGATSITVQRGTSVGGPFAPLATLPGTATVYTDAPVANNVLFYYRVDATTDSGSCGSQVIGAMAPAARTAVVVAPNVVGDTDPVARGKIVAARLTVGAVTQAASASVPAGQIISQNPPAGSSVPLNSAVAFVVSSGPANVSVPNVVNLTQAAATTAITNAGLVLGTVTQANHATVPAGNVISQNPTSGTSVAPGSAVAIVVSLGPANVNVPNVVNLTQAAATTAITNAGLVLGTVTQANHATVPAGNVISQNPTSGTSVAPGSAVAIVVSLGPANVNVPNVVNLTQAAATTAITNAGLVLGTVTQANHATVPAGNVISQNPTSGTSVAPGSAVAIVVSLGPANVNVPNVVNLTQAAATTAITNAGLVLGTVTQANHATVPAGNVISQNPTSGTSVAPGSAVAIVVSLGPANVNVPNVVNLTQAAATTAITNAGLVLGTVTQANHATVPAGNVISQNPTSGTSVAPGSAVAIVVSLGPANVNVPNVVNLTQAAATTAITNAGLVLGTVTQANHATVPAGNVISQNPTSGTSVAPGSAVAIVVSLGPANVNVPNVVNLTQAAATTAITNAGLVLGTVTQANHATVPAGNVISQNPTSGTSVAPGSAVAIVVSLGPANVNVPNVVNLTQAAATTAITNAGLVLGTVTQANHATVPAGNVISQNPTSGTSVAPGSAVAIVVSLGPANVSVPNVLNLTQAAATTAITNAGLVLGTVTQANHATVPAGNVISQNPTSGTSVAPGSAVAIVVSLGPANVSVPNVLNLTQAAATTAITNTGLVLGTVTQANDPVVPIGSVASQAPTGGTSVAPGSAVDLVISLGPASGAPATLSLLVSQALVGSGGTIDITAEVKTAADVVILPTPAITYSIIVGVGATGTVPGINGAQVTTSPNTRGNYTLRGTVNGTAVTADVGFTVVDGAPASTNVGKLVKLSASENGAANSLADLFEALEDGNLGAVAGINAALQAAKNLSPITGPNTVRRSAAVAPETGFLPTPARLQSNGYPTTAADTAFAALLPQIVTKLDQITNFYATLNPASATDSVAQLNTLNNELLALRNQLFSLAITPRGIVNNSRLINNIIANEFPEHLHALAGRVNTVLQDGGLLSQNIRPEQFFGQKPAGELALATPGAFYGKAQPAFFGLLGLMAGSSLQMNLVNQMYGEIMQEVTRMLVILVADGLIDAYTNFANLEGITTGGSLSVHAFGIGGTVEGYGMDRQFLGRNEVFLVGPAAVSAIQAAASACNPTGWDSLQDVYGCFDAIVNGLGDAYEQAHQPPDSAEAYCLLDFFESASCTTLNYNAPKFDDVNDTRFPSPVIVLYHNLDTGSRAFFTANFAP